MKTIRLILPLLLGVALTGCLSEEPPERIDLQGRPDKGPWTNLRANDASSNFHFVVMADRTGGRRPGVFESAVEKVNLLQPAFVLCVGDLVEGYTEDEATLHAQRDEFDAIVRRLSMPFFYTVGNHDATNDVMDRTYRACYGQPYYHFVYKDVLFLVLDTEDPPRNHAASGFSDEQLRYVREALEKNAGVRWTFVLMHKPLFVPEKDGAVHPAWEKVESLLGDRRCTVFAGHWHVYARHMRKGQPAYRLATTGGVSKLRGPAFGEFDHVVWVTMTEREPILANLLLDGIQPDDVATPDSIREATAAAAAATQPSNP